MQLFDYSFVWISETKVNHISIERQIFYYKYKQCEIRIKFNKKWLLILILICLFINL